MFKENLKKVEANFKIKIEEYYSLSMNDAGISSYDDMVDYLEKEHVIPIGTCELCGEKMWHDDFCHNGICIS